MNLYELELMNLLCDKAQKHGLDFRFYGDTILLSNQSAWFTVFTQNFDTQHRAYVARDAIKGDVPSEYLELTQASEAFIEENRIHLEYLMKQSHR